MKISSSRKRYLAFLLSLTILISLFSFSSGQSLNVNADTMANETQAAAEEPQWNFVRFGQSTSDAYNTITLDDTNKTVTVTAGLKDGTKTGGKITGSHDGISYYYTEIDPSKNFEISADIMVNFFAKPTPDNQEGFGIMARDAIGVNGDTNAFPSNMVMVGGYRSNVQSVFRNNVRDASGAGATMEGVTRFGDRPANDGTATYKMTMKKTNTGYHVSVNDGREKIYYRPKQLEVLNPAKVYVGFFAARVASITVSNISIKTSDVATDPPGLPEPPAPVAPSVNITSLSYSSTPDYDFNVITNANGELEVKQADAVIYNGPVEGNKAFIQGITLIEGDNKLDVKFTPGPDENVTDFNPVNTSLNVTYKTYGEEDGAVYVTPTGNTDAAATENDPIDIYSAVKFLRAGQTIYVLSGNYNLTAPITIDRGNNGFDDKLKVLSAYSDERPVFDFGTTSNGFSLNGDYWKVCGIDVTRAASTGFGIAGNYNIVEAVNVYGNGNTGLQISGSNNERIDKWPSCNLVLSCEAHDNRDPSENNADGFAAKLTTGVENIFRGCISHNNADDGWDLYAKLETGAIGEVTIEDCVAYENGYLTGHIRTMGDGNGFKLGGEGLVVNHVLRNSLSFGNFATGVTSNSDPAITVENVTSLDNGKANFEFSYFNNAEPQFEARDNISFRTSPGEEDDFPAYLASEDNFFFSGTATVNSAGMELTTSDFINLEQPSSFERNIDGSIAFKDYAELTPLGLLKQSIRFKMQEDEEINNVSTNSNPIIIYFQNIAAIPEEGDILVKVDLDWLQRDKDKISFFFYNADKNRYDVVEPNLKVNGNGYVTLDISRFRQK